tara:strand:- start:5318 stop:6091 length:774 start_codon:yes stop_codon:yes gene_type:complete
MIHATLQTIAARARHAASRVADLALPPQCLSCGLPVSRQGGLCGPCWSGIDFISRPFCEVSGLPFAFDPGGLMVRPDVATNPPPYAKARSVMQYNDASAALVLRFKYADRMEAAPAFAGWMVRAGAEVLAGADLVLPVPLHRRRLFTRRYNQSAELARLIAAGTGLGFAPELLTRVRATRPQVGLSGDARRRNVAGAFAVPSRLASRVRGKTIVLVDDVMTTGATIDACARVLAAAGATELRVLTLARVVQSVTVSV